MILIPMAGESRRFVDAGYTVPKYRLPLAGRTVFEHAVGSFQSFFSDTPFAFVVRDADGAAEFVRTMTARMGIADARIVVLGGPTRGQAETVALGLGDQERSGGPLTVFNIDTFRPGFRYPPVASEADGYLEVFHGSGANWSYVLPEAPGSDRVAETAEKRQISDLCCTGLYHFASAGLFLSAFEAYAHRPLAGVPGGELYVAPLYNLLIRQGYDIRFTVIGSTEVVFCGVPAEYEALRSAP